MHNVASKKQPAGHPIKGFDYTGATTRAAQAQRCGADIGSMYRRGAHPKADGSLRGLAFVAYIMRTRAVYVGSTVGLPRGLRQRLAMLEGFEAQVRKVWG